MGMLGLFGLLVAFAAVVVSVVCLLSSRLLADRSSETSLTLVWGGRLVAIFSTIALAFCCALLVWAFFTGDMSLDYVLRNHSNATGGDAWLFKLSGLWAGRQGSLLFWATLISIFNCAVVIRTRNDGRPLDDIAIMIGQVVIGAFVGVLLFSEDNMPFILTDPAYFDSEGALTNAASLLGMNNLLEHWAMAIHPPTLFIGYAGLTIPFAYAISALIVNDSSSKWLMRATPYALFSWVFLTIGIGLGAIWAYVVLGWGGYWGWDPVENASLLPWLISVALMHSFTIYRQRGVFKRWAVMCACLAFATVILGTFITRSGLVQSVHAFEGDPVSLVLFLGLMIASIAAGVIGVIVRRKSFGIDKENDTEVDSLLSREAAYYLNNLILIVFTILLVYMTLSSALPDFLPFGGQSLSAGTYNAIARPLGILYCLLIAICPLLGWRHSDKKSFWKNARIPGLCAIFAFVVLAIYFFTCLLPSYDAILDEGGSAAQGLLEQGAPWYYNGIAIIGMAVSSLLLFNSIFMATKAVKSCRGVRALRNRLSAFGGAICHAAIGVIVIGLIGSSMYVTEVQTYVPYDKEADTAGTVRIQDFELTYESNSIEESGTDIYYSVTFNVLQDGASIGSVSPSVQLDTTTQQEKLNAAVIALPLEDLFVVYKGVDSEGAFSMDIRVNPLISVLWIGFALLVFGSVLPLFSRRRNTISAGIEAADKD